MSLRAQPRLSFDCNAKFVVYSLLCGFGSVTERERDATQFILGLLPCFMNSNRRLAKAPMTNDAYTTAQLYLPELRVMASRHSYVHRGPLKSSKHAQALLNVVVCPLVIHLSPEDRKQLLGSIRDAEMMLSNPPDVLNELVAAWRVRHLELFTNWRSLPIAGVDEYYFGIKLPVPLELEEVLTPLPYPPIVSRTAWTRCERTPHGYMTLPLCDRRTLSQQQRDSRQTSRSIPSRSIKKSDLKPLNSSPQYFILPDLTRSSSDSSSISTDGGRFSILSSSPLLEHEIFEESTWDLVEDWVSFHKYQDGIKTFKARRENRKPVEEITEEAVMGGLAYHQCSDLVTLDNKLQS
ncbi:unnamed protein product [Rhizoctonia solani]|uniref:Uncharacterized protein n=1 Tax=Rhizoctonia solani TaxID=456999 RepID=A0A8H2XJI0_9AGAM|nr:unnamed protein product [Rhizoctonia solani]